MLRRQILTLAASALALGSLAFGVQAEELKDPFPVKGKVTVADFGAKWCAGCPEMEKIMIELQKEYGDRAAFVVVDIDKYQGIPSAGETILSDNKRIKILRTNASRIELIRVTIV